MGFDQMKNKAYRLNRNEMKAISKKLVKIYGIFDVSESEAADVIRQVFENPNRTENEMRKELGWIGVNALEFYRERVFAKTGCSVL